MTTRPLSPAQRLVLTRLADGWLLDVPADHPALLTPRTGTAQLVPRATVRALEDAGLIGPCDGDARPGWTPYGLTDRGACAAEAVHPCTDPAPPPHA